ncbi:[FeFe] hydrogenase H-cluster maturation GTPase HydF [Anaerotignum sp.]|nr:[FeFe] hydrogenase H-cluster maturation GTPase HydF [Anaerotignum sp.]MBQ7758035.1 [FeFe] hydrogenase H-cluster maturation GTPase HydF [Anaerotignum sp.]
MGLNNTPMAERIHIGIFGKRNAGKSSIINAMTGQDLAIVSDIAGTTTDPVLKAMELLPLGPVVIIDTPGLDDEGELGKLRVQKAYQVLNKTDIAVVVIDGFVGMTAEDEAILERIRAKNIPYIIVKNKSDLKVAEEGENTISVSAKTGRNIYELKERIAALVPSEDMTRKIVGDLLEPNDFAVLVVPIDSAAPKGRLILPQQQTIRDILEAGAVSIVTRDHELKETLASLGKRPKLVITDSQIFGRVSKEVPADIQLTSFSILMARYKGDLVPNVKGARALENLKDGDTVLISEGCTHHRQCEDIGTVKLPRWIKEHTGKELNFQFTSGTEFPLDLSPYALIVHCGGCMLNEREMKYRLKCAEDQGVPMTNYGICIAYINGILERSLAPFGI